jgi:hypothetical protein
MSTRIIVTPAEVALLQRINAARAPLQAQLTEHAKRVFEVWRDRKRATGEENKDYSPTFISAELIEDGSAVEIEFQFDYDGFDTKQFPIEWFLDVAWVAESDALIKQAREKKV